MDYKVKWCLIMKDVILKFKHFNLLAHFNLSHTAQSIWEVLPIRATVNTWGEEIYFEIPVKCTLEKDFARELVEPGDLGYWPEGNCFCIFFGPTPLSEGDEIRPASAVAVIGKVDGVWEPLKTIRDGAKIILEKNNG